MGVAQNTRITLLTYISCTPVIFRNADLDGAAQARFGASSSVRMPVFRTISGTPPEAFMESSVPACTQS